MPSVSLARRWWLPVALLIGLVTLGKPWLDIPGFMSGSAHHQRSLDFQLFDAFSYPTVWYLPWLNTFGNIALFIPLGVLLAAGSRHRIAAATGLSFLVSLAIETAQYVFAIGYTDVDDLLANTVGGLCGGILFSVLPRRESSRLIRVMGVSCLVASAIVLAVMAKENLRPH